MFVELIIYIYIYIIVIVILMHDEYKVLFFVFHWMDDNNTPMNKANTKLCRAEYLSSKNQEANLLIEIISIG
jgi:hypothetical protein